jgi:hypothetical protein
MLGPPPTVASLPPRRPLVNVGPLLATLRRLLPLLGLRTMGQMFPRLGRTRGDLCFAGRDSLVTRFPRALTPLFVVTFHLFSTHVPRIPPDVSHEPTHAQLLEMGRHDICTADPPASGCAVHPGAPSTTATTEEDFMADKPASPAKDKNYNLLTVLQASQGEPDRDLYALGVATQNTRWFTQVGTGRPNQDSPFCRDADAIAQDLLSGRVAA